ncbi:pilus assembly protein [Sanguibacter sp. A247]|uniref:pilus assembly protein n=1 Tax=unclassified Sanguibacter TaxID=2645534 RepID=UPI003FD787C6
MTDSSTGSDAGSAAIELVAAVVLLVLPVVYLVVAIAQVQAASFATEGAARDAVRAYVIADDEAIAVGRAEAVVALAFGDHGIDSDAARVHVTCSATPCLTPGEAVDVRVATRVVLPGTDLMGLPGLAVSVSGQHRGVIESLREKP